MKDLVYKIKEYIYKHFVIHFLYKDNDFIDLVRSKYDVMLIAPPGTKQDKIDEIIFRLNYFIYNPKLLIIRNVSFLPKTVDIPALVTSEYDLKNNQVDFQKSVFQVDYTSIHADGWEWHRLINTMYPYNPDEVVENSKRRFIELKKQLKDRGAKAYIFGTGPSLSNYSKFDFSDGVKIFCNTIVKDKETWDSIKPDIFVAADAHYHYDFNEFSLKFREDLKQRLRENPNCKFIYRLLFHNFIVREFAEFSDRLIAIPEDFDSVYINTDFESNYKIPMLGNVLDLMLIPLACNFSKEIILLGFDGRKPDDKMFWGYSEKHSYSDLIVKIKEAHPQFFEKLVPENDPGNYVRVTFRDLDKYLTELEAKGWKFKMLYPSYTEALMKRYKE